MYTYTLLYDLYVYTHITLHCIALHYITLLYVTCIALHCIALHCSALHCIALHYIYIYISLVPHKAVAEVSLSAPLAGNRTARKLQNFSQKVKKFSTFRLFAFFEFFEQKSPGI